MRFVASLVFLYGVLVAFVEPPEVQADSRRSDHRDRDHGGDDSDDDDSDDDDDGGDALEGGVDGAGRGVANIDADGAVGRTHGVGPGLRPTRPATGVPSVAEVLEAAYAAAGLDRDPTPSWRRRARAAGLIPWVTVKVGWDQNWRDDEPGDVGRSRDFEVRATWRLDRLLFDGRELQMATIDTARRRERRRVASRVIRAYFQFRRVAAMARREPERFGLATEAAAAELDALTDGWFSEQTNSPR